MKINHLLIRASDLKKMSLFFTEVIGLNVGFRPPFSFPGVWLYQNEKPIIHLVEQKDRQMQNDYLGASNGNYEGGLIDHIAFEGEHYSNLIDQIERLKTPYFERTVPLSHEHQVFITGPDNIKIEIVFNENKKPICN